MNFVIIYHGNCLDGFVSAWAFHRYLNNYYRSDIKRDASHHDFTILFVEGKYNSNPPNIKDRHIILVDFSYKRPILEKLLADNLSLLILDHHKTARDDLAFLEELPTPFKYFSSYMYLLANRSIETKPAFSVFDMKRSGAALAWDFCFPNDPRPDLVKYVQDRDLWLFELPKSQQVNMAAYSYDFDFKTFDRLASQPIITLMEEGEPIYRKHLKDIKDLIRITGRSMKIGGHIVPVCNMPYSMASDAGNILCVGKPFAATYYDSAKARHFSLRSDKKGLDVAKIAESYGGGGHVNASGFTMPLGWEGE